MATALVTGGGRGIGANIARELAGAGWDVVVTGRTAEEVDAVAREIGGRAVVGDVSKKADVERMVADAGDVELLVANAGIAIWERAAWDVPLDEWWHVLEVNVLGVHLCCRKVIPSMLERGGGRIVITGSGASSGNASAVISVCTSPGEITNTGIRPSSCRASTSP